jgi:hypothetical protein
MTSMDELQLLPQKNPTGKAPSLTAGETWLLYLTVALLLAVGTIGLIASFQSVSGAAARWGFTTPQLLPIAIDLAIPGFTIANLLLIRMDMELAWVRIVPWVLTAVTVYLNIQAGIGTAAKVGHGALPLVWVVCSEIAGHVYRVIIGAATGKRMDRIRRARMFLAPFRTSALWRRMVLWEETSYPSALARERERVLAQADLRERHGRLWRWRAPIRERALLRLGELAPSSERERLSVGADGERVSASAGCERLSERDGSRIVERQMVSTPERQALTPAPASALTKAPAEALAPVSATPERPTQESLADGERVSAERPTRSTASAKPKRASAPTVSALTDARTLVVRPLYAKLERRPEWTEIRDALIEAGHGKVSRPTAQRIRERLEKNHPGLASLGVDAERLSGTDS